MMNVKKLIAVLMIALGMMMPLAQHAEAQSPPDETTVFLPTLIGGAAQASSAPPTVDETDPSWDRLSPTSPVVSRADQKRMAAAPCGADTVTIVHTAERDQYVFCVEPEGDVVVIEALAGGVASRSRLDTFSDPVDLLMAVVPVAYEVPADVRHSIETGVARRATAPVVIGEVDESAPLAVNAKEVDAAAACATPSLGFSPSQTFFNNYTYCGMVAVSSTSSNNPSWHAHGASYMTAPGEGSHNHAGPHLPPYEDYYADEDEEGDARFGRARLKSCGGTTLLRSWAKASATTGSWSLFASFNVQSGYLATMQRYSNPQHSLWMGYDADDLWFRADAQGNASFGSRFYFLKYAYGESCDLKY